MSNELDRDIVVNSRIRVPMSELTFTFVRSSGPGGQNVNKVNSKAVMHWNVKSSAGVPDDVRARFLQKYNRRVNNEGELVLTSQRYRDQQRNIEDVRAKLMELLADVAKAPTKRKPVRITAGQRERRLQTKRETSSKKQQRKSGWDD